MEKFQALNPNIQRSFNNQIGNEMLCHAECTLEEVLGLVVRVFCSTFLEYRGFSVVFRFLCGWGAMLYVDLEFSKKSYRLRDGPDYKLQEA